jgi:alkylated DNA repair dioxygenase AlkB
MINFGAFDLIQNSKSRVAYIPRFYAEQEALHLMVQLQKEIQFQSDVLKIFGKTIITQRLFAWHGDHEFDYAYSGQSRIAKPWSPTILEIKKKIECTYNVRFNCCLVNYYADGSQGMAWHSDDEKVMQENGVIASLSLGAERIFEFKHKASKERIKILLGNGSLLLMMGETQKEYLHQLPKAKQVKTPRINLTFRTFVET